MNLLFFTIELERRRAGDGARDSRWAEETSGRMRPSRSIVVAIAAALGMCAAGTAVWAIGDRAPFVIGLPDWLPISARTPTDGPSTAQLNVTSVPADATVLVDGASARENSALSGSRQWRARIDVDASVRD